MAEFKAVTATKKLLALYKRIRAAAGGTSASKTISILLILIDKAISYANNGETLLISVVSESLPHLKRGAMRDFLNIMEQHGYFQKYGEAAWNRTDYIFTFGPGVRMEFFGVDSKDKVRGPRRDILFMNEANNCSYEAFDQLRVRTKHEIWLDWNPTNEFWFYTEILNNPELEEYVSKNVDFITLTYKDNEALSEDIILDIESHKPNKKWWQVYGLGQLGDLEGRIYKDWQIIDSIPHEARIERLGIDFGWSDPAVLVAIYYYNGGYIVDQLLYKTQFSNRKIADYIISAGLANVLAIGDSSEPKSIAEMLEHGIQIIGSQKGGDRKQQGIQWVADQRMSVTKRSVDVIKEYRNYMWKTDKDDKIVDGQPEHEFSHSMDAIRYAMESLRPSEDNEKVYKSGNIVGIWA